MGSPVSAVIANIFMEDFEERAIASAIYKPKIWKRYVDDTFTILDRDQVDILITNSPLFVLPWKPRKITAFPFSIRQL